MEWLVIEEATAEDIILQYRGTPMAELLSYQNLGEPHCHCTEAELLIGMCMDHRLQLRIRSNFAYVLRCAGGNRPLLGDRPEVQDNDGSRTIPSRNHTSVFPMGQCRIIYLSIHLPWHMFLVDDQQPLVFD